MHRIIVFLASSGTNIDPFNPRGVGVGGGGGGRVGLWSGCKYR